MMHSDSITALTRVFDDDSDFCETMQEAKKYYANIIMCYGKQAAGAWKIVKEMEPEMIAPSHGVIWRSHVADILNAYEHWSSSVPEAGASLSLTACGTPQRPWLRP